MPQILKYTLKEKDGHGRTRLIPITNNELEKFRLSLSRCETVTNTCIWDNLPVSLFIIVPSCLRKRVVSITNEVFSFLFLGVRRMLPVTVPFCKNHHMSARLQIEIGFSDSSIFYGTGEEEFVSHGVEEDIGLISISFEATDRVSL